MQHGPPNTPNDSPHAAGPTGPSAGGPAGPGCGPAGRSYGPVPSAFPPGYLPPVAGVAPADGGAPPPPSHLYRVPPPPAPAPLDPLVSDALAFARESTSFVGRLVWFGVAALERRRRELAIAQEIEANLSLIRDANNSPDTIMRAFGPFVEMGMTYVERREQSRRDERRRDEERAVERQREQEHRYSLALEQERARSERTAQSWGRIPGAGGGAPPAGAPPQTD